MSIKFTRIKKHLELDDQIRFGAHSGRTISWMLQFEPEYLLWATQQPGLIFLQRNLTTTLQENALRAKTEKTAQKEKQFQRAVSPDYIEDLGLWLDDVPF